MDFFRKAQEFATSAGSDETPEAKSEGGFGSMLSGASGMMKTGEGGADHEAAALPGGRHAPSNSELLQSTQLLFGAAQGQNVEKTKLAGAAEDLLGGLAAYGNLDEGQYSSYINQAEGYLHKYAGEDGTPAPRAAAREGAAPEPDSPSDAPAEIDDAAPARRGPRASADEEDTPAQRD